MARKKVCLLVSVCFSIFSIGCQKEENIKEALDDEIFDLEIMLFYDPTFKSDFSQADYDRFVELVTKNRNGRARINLLSNNLGLPFDLQWLCG